MRSHRLHPWDDLSPYEASSWSEGKLLKVGRALKPLALLEQHILVLLLCW